MPVVTSCGTGVTACILALVSPVLRLVTFTFLKNENVVTCKFPIIAKSQGLHRLGKTDVPVYDGSWTEWGANPDTPVASTQE